MSPSWIRARVRKYAAQVGVGFVPRVVFSEKEWRRLTPRAQWKKVVGHDTVAVAYDRTVYFNKSKACCRRNADDSAAHETVHLWKPEMRHGERFERFVSEILLGRVPE